MHETADLVLVNGKITTLDRANPQARAVAILDGRFQAVGEEREIIALAGPETRRIDLNGRRVIPGLIDNHMHVIRGGLNYNMELRWDGVWLARRCDAHAQGAGGRTPAPQWVRVMGGFTDYQFAEKRLPTLDEINAVAPDTPVFILHLYDRALLNGRLCVRSGTPRTRPNPPGGEIERDAHGNPTGLLIAKPNARILYATLAKGPKLPPEYQLNSTRHFMRELNRLGVTSVIDAGGGFQNYPDDYGVIEELHRDGELTMRIAYNLFTQKPRQELDDFSAGRAGEARSGRRLLSPQRRRRDAGLLCSRLRGLPSTAAGHAARHGRRAGARHPAARAEPLAVAPARDLRRDDHARARRLRKGQPRRPVRRPALVLRPCRDDRRPQHRADCQRSGAASRSSTAWHTRASISSSATGQGRRAHAADPSDAGDGRAGRCRNRCDAGRLLQSVGVALSWLVTGRTVGGLAIYPEANLLDRETALRLWTEANTWFSSESGKKGQIKAGQLADLAVLSDDYFSVPEDRIAGITSVLTILGGKTVHADDEFKELAPPLPPAMPDWSPVRHYGGYQQRSDTSGSA